MSIDKVTLAEKLALFSEHWSPRIVGELNGQHVKLVKFQGEFVWHHHEHEDELFLVISGSFDMHFRDRVVALREGSFSSCRAASSIGRSPRTRCRCCCLSRPAPSTPAVPVVGARSVSRSGYSFAAHPIVFGLFCRSSVFICRVSSFFLCVHLRPTSSGRTPHATAPFNIRQP